MNAYCKRDNTGIIDQYGNPLFLKGVGIGGWLLLEGYMIKSYQNLDRPRRIKDYITACIDESYVNYFFSEWVKRFFQKDDIKQIKKHGFNCIRIPIDYQFLFEPSDSKTVLNPIGSHFVLLDEIIAECAKESIYVMLDLHAAPGGQTGTNIDNSEDDKPGLFLNALYQDQTINIWQVIANRYKNEPYIVAYDLLNEPLPNWFSEYYPKLMPLYKKIIRAIREVDPHHMITLEGVHWSTDLSIFASLPDDNILLQFHKYWSNPDGDSIYPYLMLRKTLNVPLIMGEGGENNLSWYSTTFKLYEDLNISFVFWTYKKMAAKNSITTFKEPKNWDKFLAHELTKSEARKVLDNLLEMIQCDQTKVNTPTINHILRKDEYTLPAYAFDTREANLNEQTINNLKTSLRVSDGVKIADKSGRVITPNFKQYGGEGVPQKDQLYVFLNKGETLKYTLNNTPSSYATITIDCDYSEHIITDINYNKVFHHNGKLIVDTADDKIILTIHAGKPTKISSLHIKHDEADNYKL